ncbi:hypothetical protein HMPREF1551_00287 [Capnocytophaga sp. oral taxon 863 str. F0517]|nr:hypothetical protein HMPREF1551_00287 [Capnocytophaga sp. oral taxon 863 str. F0517]
MTNYSYFCPLKTSYYKCGIYQEQVQKQGYKSISEIFLAEYHNGEVRIMS